MSQPFGPELRAEGRSSALSVTEVGGAPGWLLDSQPYVPILAQAGAAGLAELRDGTLVLRLRQRVRLALPTGLGEAFAMTCTLNVDRPSASGNASVAPPHACVFVLLEGRTAAGRISRYSAVLTQVAAGLCVDHSQQITPSNFFVIHRALSTTGQSVRLRLIKEGDLLRLDIDGEPAGAWRDPTPMVALKQVLIATHDIGGMADDLIIEDAAGQAVVRGFFDDAQKAGEHWQGDLLPAAALPASSFFTAGCQVYTTWEHGPQLSLVWQEDGGDDWSEVGDYLDKLAALDPDSRLHCRFFFDAPPWWIAGHGDQMVQVRHLDGRSQATSIVSAAAETYWARAEQSARDFVRYCVAHPEGWRLVGVLFSGGFCEWFPHWGAGYSDYSPAFLAGFRAWLQERYGSVAPLRAAWRQDKATFDTAELPAPAERVRGDFYDFYDPAAGRQRQDFCLYYSTSVTRIIQRIAKAFKEASHGRLYVRTMSGYQPGSRAFRFHTGPHADFASVLACPWLDGFFMPHDYRGRGCGGFTGFELPVTSVLLHGKTYITEIDDRTHHVQTQVFGTTWTPWQTAQSLKRNVATALCHGSGAEFKDWAAAWFEDEQTMPVIRQLSALAQASTRHDRRSIAQIAVIVNPMSTCHIRDDSKLYESLNCQQMHNCYPRLGAPHDRLMVDDLAMARDYRLYIVQDAMHLTEAQRRLIRDTLCTAGQTVLWLFAPGLIGEAGVSVAAMSDLVGMRIGHRHGYGLPQRLRLTNPDHPYTRSAPIGVDLTTLEGLTPIFAVEDPAVVTLGWGGDVHNVQPAFAVKAKPDWTSVYCAVPALPPGVIRNIAREAGVHVYCETNDFVAANDWLLTLCASCDGPRTIRLPRKATIVDAMTDRVDAHDTDSFRIDMQHGETGVWRLERP